MTLQEIKQYIGLKPYYETELGVLYCADCLDVMAKMPEKCVDLVLTDPPYGIDFCSSRTSRKEKLANDKLTDWLTLIREVLPQFFRIITDVGCCCCCCGGGGKTPVTAIFTMELIQQFKLIQTLVWKKFVGLGWKYRPAYENIIIFSKDDKSYSFYDKTKKCSNVIEGINQDIPQYRGKEAGYSDDHPTQKPTKLMELLINIHSKRNDLTIDPFLGSGTTAVACEKLGRQWIGVEISEKYCEVAAKRIDAEARQVKLF